jgi:hypothetical protein
VLKEIVVQMAGIIQLLIILLPMGARSVIIPSTIVANMMMNISMFVCVARVLTLTIYVVIHSSSENKSKNSPLKNIELIKSTYTAAGFLIIINGFNLGNGSDPFFNTGNETVGILVESTIFS